MSFWELKLYRDNPYQIFQSTQKYKSIEVIPSSKLHCPEFREVSDVSQMADLDRIEIK
jgi:hypothetical protein